GGIIGRKIQLVSYDDAGDPTKANSNVKRLIEEDKVDLIIGGTTSGATMAMIPPVEKAEIPFISLAGAVVIVEPVHKWVFKTPHTDRMAAEKVFEDMKKRGITKVGLLAENSAFGQSGKKETLAVAPRYGMTIVADEMYGPKDADVTTQLTKIKNTPGVQAIFVFGFGQGPSVVTKNYGQLGIKLPLYQSHGVGSEQYIQLSGKAAEGVRLPAAALLVAKVLPDSDPQKAVVTSYANAYKDHFKADVSTFGGHAYDGLMLAVDAIKRAGSTDKAKVRDALEQTRGYIGTGGLVNMSATDHMGLDLTAFRMLEVENGAWKLVK
ncbi:MAG: ABC transporter substrate-binding protein, partial [Deltaproteobacteria bacterium]